MSSGKYNFRCLKLREVSNILKANGYNKVRNNGHDIWKNNKGDVISIPRSVNPLIIQKLFKDNSIIF